MPESALRLRLRRFSPREERPAERGQFGSETRDVVIGVESAEFSHGAPTCLARPRITIFGVNGASDARTDRRTQWNVACTGAAHPVQQQPKSGAQALPTYDRHVRPVEKERIERQSKGEGRERARGREARVDVAGIQKSTVDRCSNVFTYARVIRTDIPTRAPSWPAVGNSYVSSGAREYPRRESSS